MLQLSRPETAKVYLAIITALEVPDQIGPSSRASAIDSMAHAFTHLPAYAFLTAYVLSEVIGDYIHASEAELFSISVAQVGDLAEVNAAVAVRALSFLGLFRSPLNHGTFTNTTARAVTLELPPDLFEHWRSFDL